MAKKIKFDRDGDRIVIAGAIRTPVGQAGSALSGKHSFELGSLVVNELINPMSTALLPVKSASRQKRQTRHA
jgi:hypothetical protein